MSIAHRLNTVAGADQILVVDEAASCSGARTTSSWASRGSTATS
ncbi:MAG: hypothetical protein ACLTMP_05710 [Eggerthella lenta]